MKIGNLWHKAADFCSKYNDSLLAGTLTASAGFVLVATYYSVKNDSLNDALSNWGMYFVSLGATAEIAARAYPLWPKISNSTALMCESALAAFYAARAFNRHIANDPACNFDASNLCALLSGFLLRSNSTLAYPKKIWLRDTAIQKHS